MTQPKTPFNIKTALLRIYRNQIVVETEEVLSARFGTANHFSIYHKHPWEELFEGEFKQDLKADTLLAALVSAIDRNYVTLRITNPRLSPEQPLSAEELEGISL